MSDKPDSQKPPQVQINVGDEILRGRYSNNIMMAHSPEEFILDWLLNSPSGVHLVSRIIVSPGHIKRIINMLKINLDDYEKKFGPIKEIAPSDQQFH